LARAQDAVEVSALPTWWGGQAGVTPPPVSGPEEPAGAGQTGGGVTIADSPPKAEQARVERMRHNSVEQVTSPALKLPLNGYVSVWSQDCSVADDAIGRGNRDAVSPVANLPESVPPRQAGVTSEPCAIPLPLVKNRAITFELALPQAPGQAQPGTVKEIFSLPEAGELSLTLKFYAVCPYAAAKSFGTCPALYFQAQAELAGAAGAFCGAAFNEKDFAPFPVLMCGGGKTRGVRFGITLHRVKL